MPSTKLNWAIKALKNLLNLKFTGKKPGNTRISKQVKLFCCNQLLSMESHQKNAQTNTILAYQEARWELGQKWKKNWNICFKAFLQGF